jgi:defect-in-organelle-trafficking protein DotD
MNMKRHLIAFCAGIGLVGCASTSPQSAAVTPDSEAYARQIMVEKVDAAVQSLRELVATTQEGRDMVARKQAALDDDEVDIDYAGKPQPLLESIAHRYGYKYVETGRRVELRTINLRVSHARVVEVLRDVGLQTDTGADVVLDKDAKIIRLIYKKA